MTGKLWLTALLALAILCSACAPPTGEGSAATVPSEQSPQTPRAQTIPVLRCLYYERDLFLGGMSAPRLYEISGELVAGLVPHHLLASDMIAGFFSLAAEQKDRFDTVVLLSPSHFPEQCDSDVVTANAGWDTPYGKVEPDSAVVEALLGNRLLAAEDNPAAVEADHGVAGLVPFVRYFLPDAKVAVCLLANRLSPQRLEAVQQELAALCAGGRVLLVASTDCSHYLQPPEAALRDAETAEAIQALDFPRILGFDDRNSDSPQALTAFLRVAQGEGSEVLELDHSSSAEKLPHGISSPLYDEGITTYFVYAAVTP